MKHGRFQLIVVDAWGGLGDGISRLPAIKYALDTWEHLNIVFFANDYFLEFAKACLQHPRLVLRPRSAFNPEVSKLVPVVDFKPHDITSLRRHLVDFAFQVLTDNSPPSLDSMRYLPAPAMSRPTGLPKRYAVITPNYTAPARAWRAPHINAYCLWLLTQNVTPVFLGKKENKANQDIKVLSFADQDVDYSLGYDLRERTSLLEAAQIIQHAEFVAGVDNGLLHLAASTNTPIVFGLTTLEARHRIPVRDRITAIEPLQTLKCGGCQSKFHYVDHDFRTCYYNHYECLDHMTAERFINASKKYLNQ